MSKITLEHGQDFPLELLSNTKRVVLKTRNKTAVYTPKNYFKGRKGFHVEETVFGKKYVKDATWSAGLNEILDLSAYVTFGKENYEDESERPQIIIELNDEMKGHSHKAPTKKCKFVCPEKMF